MISLQERIAARLNTALDQLARGDLCAPDAERGLAVGGPYRPDIVLSVDDVARIAAEEAELGYEARSSSIKALRSPG